MVSSLLFGFRDWIRGSLAKAMAASDQYSPSILLQFMNDLWFRQNIVLKTKIIQAPISEKPSQSPPPPLQLLASPPASLIQQSELGIHYDMDTYSNSKLERPTTVPECPDFVIKHRRIHLGPAASSSKIGSFSLSPGAQTRKRRRLPKMSSCKSFAELENEEIKGFMDLGFIFKEDQVTDHVMSVIPGLRKLGEKKKLITRPYLSEAWLINRPNSPLLDLRMPPISAASGADMKKHLRFWARTVADEVL
ncbi:uncharacterized protein [Aristolochia californica]|uniref:uncharacterized protein n=1 Tax=Aristolochia californica TaxID=171875 RepID=UPI0035D65596